MREPGTPPIIGIIGGSGLYEIDGLENVEWRALYSSFGMPSDEFMFAELDGQKLVFLPRHGRGHHIPPSELNFRANIDALKRANVTEILSLSAVGSLREDLPPGTFGAGTDVLEDNAPASSPAPAVLSSGHMNRLAGLVAKCASIRGGPIAL